MRRGLHHAAQQGFSQIELAVAVSIFAVLGGVLLERLLYLEEYAEKAAMELTVAHLRVGLRNQMGDLLIRDKVSEIATLADENPVVWLQKPPENYLGEFDGEPGEDLRGKWYFDRGRHELVYTANNRRYFVPAANRDRTVRLRVVRLPVSANGMPVRKKAPQWVTLVQVTDGKWF